MDELHISPNMIKRTRGKLGMSRLEFGRALGFVGSKRTVDKEIIRLERGKSELWPAKRIIFAEMIKEIREYANQEIVEANEQEAEIEPLNKTENNETPET